MIKLDETNIENLEDLLEDHWNHLNPKAANDDFASHSLIKKIEKALDQENNLPENKQFLEFLLYPGYDNLKGLLLSKPNVLQGYIDDINRDFGVTMFSNGGINPTLTDFGRRISQIFSYTDYRGRGQCKNTVDRLRISCCAYCNKDEIEIVGEDHGGDDLRLYGMIDHFYAQSRYPYLALSFFNLIPSCFKCNSQLKRQNDFRYDTHINLFDKSFDELFKFRFLHDPLNDINDLNIEIVNRIEYPNYQVTVFDLTRRYNTALVKKAVYDGITGYENNTAPALESLSSQLGNIDLNIEKAHRLYGLPVDPNDIIRTPLGKLKRDVCKQIGVLDD